MDYDVALDEDFIIIPQTYIKPPGSPFRNNFSISKDRFSFTSLTSISLPSLIEEFKLRCNSKVKSSDDMTIKSPGRNCWSVELMMKRYSSWDSTNKPGEMKKNSDDDAELIRLSQKILSFFGISLINKAASSPSRNIYKVLKFLIPEICLFPTEFFEKLQIAQLVFSEEEPDQQSPSTKDVFFSLATLDSQVKVIEKLYQVIFIHILRQNPPKEDQRSFSGVYDLEKTFIALMKNSNAAHLKSKVDELKKWMSEQYPELTEEWFKNRSIEKKKLARVTFM